MVIVGAALARAAALDALVVQGFWSLPALAAPVAIGVAACGPRAGRRMALACGLVLPVLGGCVALRLTRPVPGATLAAAAVAVVAYHLLAALSWTVRPWRLRLVAVGAAHAPILAAWAVLLVLRPPVPPGATLLVGP